MAIDFQSGILMARLVESFSLSLSLSLSTHVFPFFVGDTPTTEQRTAHDRPSKSCFRAALSVRNEPRAGAGKKVKHEIAG